MIMLSEFEHNSYANMIAMRLALHFMASDLAQKYFKDIEEK